MNTPTIVRNAFLFAAFFPLLVGAACTFFFGRRRRHKRKASGLLFHSIPRTPCFGLSHLTVDRFAQLLDTLQEQHLPTCTVKQACGFVDCPEDQGGTQYIALTFDDGFADFYTNAFPELKKRGMTATVFPVTGAVDGVSNWDIYAPRKSLSKSQLRELAEAGVEIGSHTVTHPDLTFLSDEDARYELIKSKADIEDTIGQEVVSISFPFGSWNRRVWRIARECGYKSGTVYQHRHSCDESLLPVYGAYAFDRAKDIVQIALQQPAISSARARCAVLPHFAKGTPVWRFRKKYSLFNARA